MGCDSGSYIFLDYKDQLKALFETELSEQPLYLIDLPVGEYTIGYEQWDINEDNPYESWRRNIVVVPKF